MHVCNQFHPRRIQKWDWVTYYPNSPLPFAFSPVLRMRSASVFVPLFKLCSAFVQFVPFLDPITPSLGEFHLCSFLHIITMPKRYEPSSYADLFSIPEFAQCREVFLRAGWGPFLSHLQGHDDGISMQFSLSFDGKTMRVGSLTFGVSEESIVAATKLPRVGDRWFKNHQLLCSSYNRVFKPEFQNISGAKGYSKEWIKEELINPLIVITRLITCEGRYSTFKACHFRLLAHFQFNKPLNFPFYFLKSLEKMSSQVRKNVTNPHNNLFHHGLIKLLVLAELEKQGKTWDAFIYQFANPHLTIKTNKKTLWI
jgi:hypothetical protein